MPEIAKVRWVKNLVWQLVLTCQALAEHAQFVICCPVTTEKSRYTNTLHLMTARQLVLALYLYILCVVTLFHGVAVMKFYRKFCEVLVGNFGIVY